jgi:hypothetical protein
MYLRALFVQAAWVLLVKLGPKHWERYGLKSWIEAAKKRLHHNVLAIALANKVPGLVIRKPGRLRMTDPTHTPKLAACRDAGCSAEQRLHLHVNLCTGQPEYVPCSRK